MAEEAILRFLHHNSEEITDSGQFSAEHNLDHNEVVNVIKSLHGFRYIDVQVVMLGLDAAGKTTILYKLHIGEVLSTVPTIGFNVEKVQYKNVMFTVWDVGGQEKLRPLWRHYFNNTDGLIYVVDSLDRERIGKAKQEFQEIIKDPFMLNSVILVFANKQDMRGAMSPREVCEGLGLLDLKNRKWHIQGTCALQGDGLYEGLDWLSSTLKEVKAAGYSSDIKRETWVLTDEGKKYAADGSPEVQLFLAVPEEGSISKDELQKKLAPSVFKIGCSQAGKNKWVEMGKQVSRKVQHVEDKVKSLLLQIQEGKDVDKDGINSLKARKLIAPQIWKGYSVKKGPNFAPERKPLATDLTRENLQNWKELEFKEYNFNAKGAPLEAGHLHPLLKVRKQFKDIFVQMGFEEMPTNNFVESSFWNFDALFQPQQHPARDSHDTFFLKDPSTTRTLPEDYVERVKRVHESGGYGSRGYNYDWKREEANKNLLRTHTTAVSSRMLYALAQKPFVPKKYFSIDRVFRNEAVDRTHLAEFHQIEGLICDRGLTLGNLIGVLNDFFSRLGMSKLKFKPAYNPYTEPSMEIFSYHEGLGKWVEIGNSGMFRPEMLLPMGLPEDVRVIAWGLSLERPTMILYGIDNIRDLFGHKVDLDLIKRNPICRVGI